MKKTYIKPDAEYISFYSEEEIANVEIDPGDESISGDMGTQAFYGLFEWT